MKPEFLAINPAHCVPTLKDGDLVIWESRAILQYLCNKHAPSSTFYPTDPAARAKVDFLLCWDMGDLYASIMAYEYPLLGFRPMPKSIDDMKANFHKKLEFLDQHLIKGTYLTGESMTIADVSIAISLTMPEIIKADYTQYANLSKWLKTMHSHTEWQEVQAKFEPPKQQLIAKLAQSQTKF